MPRKCIYIPTDETPRREIEDLKRRQISTWLFTLWKVCKITLPWKQNICNIFNIFMYPERKCLTFYFSFPWLLLRLNLFVYIYWNWVSLLLWLVCPYSLTVFLSCYGQCLFMCVFGSLGCELLRKVITMSYVSRFPLPKHTAGA